MKHAITLWNKIKLLSVSVVAAMVLSACFPDQIDLSDYEDNRNFQTSQSEMYANALMHYAIKGQAALLEDGNWQSLTDGMLTFGTGVLSEVRMGGSEGYVASALCKQGDTALHLTWFETEDDHGELALKGLGRSSGADLMEALTRTVSGEQLAVMTEEGIRNTGNNQLVAVPGGCGELDIPSGSPVMVFALAVPEDIDRIGDVVSYEYRTLACGEGEDGNLLERRSVMYPEGGSDPIYGGWSQIENNCRILVDNEDIDVADVVNVDEGLDAGALSMLDSSGSLGQQIRGALKDTECQDVRGRDSQEGFDTCAEAEDMADLNELDEIREEASDTIEQYNQECGGVVGTESNNLWDKFYGENTYQPWEGLVVFQRDLEAYRADSELSDSGNDDLTYKRGPWYGHTIDCSRDEELKLSCSNVTPPTLSGSDSSSMYRTYSFVPSGDTYSWWEGVFGSWVGCYFGCDKDHLVTLTYINEAYYNSLSTGEQDGVYLTRTNQITTWQDVTEMTPGDPSNPDWILPDEGRRCVWIKEDPALACDNSGSINWEGHWAQDTDDDPDTQNYFKSGSAYSYAFDGPAYGLQSYDLLKTLNGYPRSDHGALITTTFSTSIDNDYILSNGNYRSYSGISAKYLTHILFQYTDCDWSLKGEECDRVTVVNSPVYRIAINARSVGASEMAQRYRQIQVSGSLPFTSSSQGAYVDSVLESQSTSTYNAEVGNRPAQYQVCTSSKSGTSCYWVHYTIPTKRPDFTSGTEYIYSVLMTPGTRETYYLPRLNEGAQIIDTLPYLQPTGDYMLCSQQRTARTSDGFYTLYDIRGYSGTGPGGNGAMSPWKPYSLSRSW